jgi:hypothetical protein
MLTNSKIGPNRRIHTRYQLLSMYTQIEVRAPGDDSFSLTGHAYDISLGGMRFELDQPIEPGTTIEVRIQLPGSNAFSAQHQPNPISAIAHVVWAEQDDIEDGGSVRMACVFHEFTSPGAERALLARLASGSYARAA